MKTIIAFLNRPLVVVTHAVLGAGFMLHLQDMAYQALLWFLPCLFIIIADLASGIPAARHRGEKVTFSKGIRATLNKVLCYSAWTLFSVCLNNLYGSSKPTLVCMGIVFIIEGSSFVGNRLELKGYELSLKGLMAMIGRKHNMDGLEDIIEKKEQ